jgi:hypothetical protein
MLFQMKEGIMARSTEKVIIVISILTGVVLFFTLTVLADSGAEYTIMKTSVPPKIDGKLNDVVWKFAEPAVIGLINANGVKAQKKSNAYMVYDDNAIYVGFQRFDKDLDSIVANTKNHDGNVWEDDEFELFLDVDHDQSTYWQIAINTNNAIFDCYNPGGGCDNVQNLKSDPQTAVSLGAKEDWFAEIKIPLKDLDVKETPKAGTIWGLNFAGHVLSGIDEWVTWSDIGASFHVPTGFGIGIFSIKLASVSPLGKLPFLWGLLKSY